MHHKPDRRQHVAVVGAGIIGLAVALRLQLDGHAVTLVDREEPMSGCSAGNAGHLSESGIFPPVSRALLMQMPRLLLTRQGPVVVRPSYALQMANWARHALPSLKPEARDAIVSVLAGMALQAFRHLHKLAVTAGAQDLLHRDGVIYAFRTREALDKSAAAMPVWRKHGVNVDRLDSGELEKAEPALRKSLAGGLYFRNSGRCSDPKELGMRFFRNLTAGGATFRQANVNNVQRESEGLVLMTSTGNFRADKVVLCGGHGTGALVSRVGCTAPVASERGYHLMLPRASEALRRPVAFPEHYFIATPMSSGLRLAGTAEFCRPGAHPDYRRAYAFLPKAAEYLDGLDGDGARPWMGVRPSMPDGLPAIGEVKALPGLLYAFGHGHGGLTLSGITASCISALLGRGSAELDIHLLDLQRFS